MHFVSPIFDLYSDYLLVNQGQTTATGLAALVAGKLSHDAITQSLHQQSYGSSQFWQVVRPFIEQIADPTAVLTLDDTVEATACMDQNPLIRFHYDHCQQKALKGINHGLCPLVGPHGSLSEQSCFFVHAGFCYVRSPASFDGQKPFCLKEFADAECDEIGFA